MGKLVITAENTDKCVELTLRIRKELGTVTDISVHHKDGMVITTEQGHTLQIPQLRSKAHPVELDCVAGVFYCLGLDRIPVNTDLGEYTVEEALHSFASVNLSRTGSGFSGSAR